MCIGGCCAILFKFGFVLSAACVIAGCSLLWDTNVFDYDGFPLKKYNFDVFMFMASWLLCFLSWLLGEDAFTVLTAGVLLACFTTRRDGQGNGNMVSVASINMCREFSKDPSNPLNNAEFFNPGYQERFDASNSTYYYTVTKTNANRCITGGALMYVGILAALVMAAYSGKSERDKSGNMITKLLAAGVLLLVVIGTAVVLTSKPAELDSPSYFNVIDVTIFVLLTGCYVYLSYFVNSVPMLYAAAVLAAYAAMINLSEMFATNGSTNVDLTNTQSGFILNELGMLLAWVLTIMSAMTGFKTKTSLKVVPVAGPYKGRGGNY